MSTLSLQTRSSSGVNVVNSKSATANNSCFTCTAGPSANLKSYLELTFMDGTPSMSYKVEVYAERMYTIKWYDASSQQVRKVTGKVLGLNSQAISLVQTSVTGNDSKVCLNCKKDRLAGYVDTQIYHIPITNIASVTPVFDIVENTPPTTTKERSETFMSILGLSSRVVRAISVEIKVFDDDVQHAVNELTMEVGGIYQVTYAAKEGKCDTLYEIEGRLIQIEEIGEFGSEPTLNGYIRPDDPHHREMVGYHGNTYDADYFHSLPKENPDASHIRFVFDTSKNFEKTFDTVILSQIRNVVRKKDTKPLPPEPIPAEWPEPCPNPDPGFCPPVQQPHAPQKPYPPHYDSPATPPAPPVYPTQPGTGWWGIYPPPPPPPPAQPPMRPDQWAPWWGEGPVGTPMPPFTGWKHPDHVGCELNQYDTVDPTVTGVRKHW